MNFVKLEEMGKKIFAKFPKIRRFLKGIYQRTMYLLSHESYKSQGDITRVSPENEFEYFYGYYDKSPWDKTNRYMIALKVRNAYKVPDSTEEAQVVVLDTKNNKEEFIGTTNCWNSQQGCMAQWLGPDFESKIIYNDFRDNKYVSVIYNFKDKYEEKVYDKPIYDVSKKGDFALTLDFSRLHRLRKGYGYANIDEETKKEKCPDKTCIWKIDLKTGKILNVLKYTDLANFETRSEMIEAEHKVNHIMISPDGNRFMVLHRWFKHNEKFTRLVTMNIDGTDMYNLSDDNFVSHCCWKNEKEILSFLRKKETGNHYYLMKDKTKEYKMLWPELNTDGHCTYSPDGKYVITDTYPNRKRIANVYLCTEEDNISRKIASVFSPFKYDNDNRCDLHPRWRHDSQAVCIDSVHEERKGVYMVKLNEKKKLVFLNTRLKKSGPINQTLDLIKELDKNKYDIFSLSLYEEINDNTLKDVFESYGVKVINLKMNRLFSIIFGKYGVKRVLNEINPDLVHSVGMPLFNMSLFYDEKKSYTTIHNYVFEDYPVKYGKLVGNLMAKKDLKIIKKYSNQMVACSKSLSDLYKKNGINVDFIRNGVDTSRYTISNKSEKRRIRKELSISNNSIVFVFTGQVCKRKNQSFAVEAFNRMNNSKFELFILGDGPELSVLQKKYSNNCRIHFTGRINNVADYLKMADIYVSSSTSEGLPIGALEAMSSGLPLLLSDIPQHKEIIDISKNIGFTFANNNFDSFSKMVNNITNKNLIELGKNSHDVANSILSSKKMTELYENKYIEFLERKK